MPNFTTFYQGVLWEMDACPTFDLLVALELIGWRLSFYLHNPVHRQHEGQVVGWEADGFQDDRYGDDAPGWDAGCTHTGSGGGHSVKEESTMQVELTARPKEVMR